MPDKEEQQQQEEPKEQPEKVSQEGKEQETLEPSADNSAQGKKSQPEEKVSDDKEPPEPKQEPRGEEVEDEKKGQEAPEADQEQVVPKDEAKEPAEPAGDQEQNVTDNDVNDQLESSEPAVSTDDKEAAAPEPESPNRDVLWVECAKDMVNRDCRQLLETLGMNVIPWKISERYGESLAEKWEQQNRAKFAVVTLSGEEFRYAKDGKPADSRLCSAQENIFALGFLLAKLGRLNVFVLYYEQNTFSIPTDMQEVVYVPYNRTRAWQELLKSRLKMAGLLT